eukprot:gene18631-37641_t
MRIKSLFITAAAALALAACGSGDSAGAPKGEPIAKVAAPAGKAWTDVVTKTEAGGYKMGNPDAKLQLVEYGAITCPGCAQFSVQSTEELNEIVNTGVVASPSSEATAPGWRAGLRCVFLRDLRIGTFDVLVGINLLREGLDLPEVSLVAILDADKEGFLRSERSLIQTIGRAARNLNGVALLYADRMTDSMERAI